jgi:hypothetical protein
MFSITDFLPTLASIVGSKMPTDRAIDGVDQSDLRFGRSVGGHRETLLSFIAQALIAERWKQWRIYFTDVHPRPAAPTRFGIRERMMAGYPNVYNIEMPARGPERDGVVRLGRGPSTWGRSCLRAFGQGAPEPAGTQYHALRSGRLTDILGQQLLAQTGACTVLDPDQ